MAKICCVDGCSTAIEGIFFKFPNSRTLRRKWLNLITTSKRLPDDSLVCSQHFLEDEYEVIRGKTRLKAKVVPSLFIRTKSKSPEYKYPNENSADYIADSKSNGVNNLETNNTTNNVPDTNPDNRTTDNPCDIVNDKTVYSLPKKSPELNNTEQIKENGDIKKDTQSAQELSDIENKDIEDIITNYHIKQTVPNRLHSPERDAGTTDSDSQNNRRDRNKDIIEINDDHAEPQFIEISADKGQTGQPDNQDCLMVLENVQVEVDPNLMFPEFEEEEDSNDSDVIDLGEKKEDPISLLTSSDEDEVIIEEPRIDTVEVSDETDEDDVPLVKLVKTKKNLKSKSKSKSNTNYGLEQVMWDDDYEYYCMECHYTTQDGVEFKKHKNTHSTIFEVCPICSFTTASKSQFIRHKRKHKFEKRYQCHICEYKAKHHMSLIYHLKTHKADSGKCDRCGYTSSVKIDLFRHIKQCCIKRCYKCDQCKYQTLRRSDLKRHRLRVHGECDDEQDIDYTPG